MCRCHFSTHLPSPLMRTAWKMASHSLSIASLLRKSGNTFFAQLGMGMRRCTREAAAHLEAVKVLQGLAAGLLGPDDPAAVHALEVLRVAGGDGQIRRPPRA